MKDKLILNSVWYLSYLPEHLDPNVLSTKHWEEISKQIGSCQMIYVFIKGGYEYFGFYVRCYSKILFKHV